MSAPLTIMLIASCVAASCALVGSFLVLRRMTLLGDAISHAVLPGIVVAFLLTGHRSTLPMVLGAGALGVVTVLLVELFDRTGRLKEDASIGVVFPALFALGVVLISRYAGQVDLDLDCVLYGEIAYAPLDTVWIGGRSWGPRALWVNLPILVVVASAITLLFKELELTTFDPGLGASLGFSPRGMHYLLMTLVSVTVVGAFESVGAILVVAMLVVPPATAYLLTDRLGPMLFLGVLFGIGAAVGGYGLAYLADASIAGAMATTAGVFFLLALLLSPGYGVLARGLRQARLSRAMAEWLLLLHLREGGRPEPIHELRRRFSWSAHHLDRIISRLASRGWILRRDDSLTLTPDGATAIERSGHLALRHVTGNDTVG